MILYTDDDIPIIYNPIQLQYDNNIVKNELENEIQEIENKKIIEIPKKNIVNKLVSFISNCFCCYRNNNLT